MKIVTVLIAVVISLKPLAAVADDPAWAPKDVGAAEVIPVSFKIESGWEYDGRIELPDPSVRRPWAVMILGGGLGTAIDWYIPDFMTIDGEATRDGDTIARALLARGFVVMRWHAIHRDDPLFAADGLMMEVPKPPQTVEQAEQAMAAFRAKNVVPDDHIFLLGHSLGAARAAMLVDKHRDCPGVVMLAGASLIPTKLDVVREIVADSTEATERQSPTPSTTERHENVLRRLADKRDAWSLPVDESKTRLGTPWAANVLLKNRTPTLLMVGAEDERWLIESYAFTDHLRQSKHPDYTWWAFEGVGHNLGREIEADVSHGEYGVIAKSKVGPINEDVVKAAVNWLVHRARD